MTATTSIPAPPAGFAGSLRFSLRAREKKSFNTVLDAHSLLARTTRPESEAVYADDGDDVVLTMNHPMGEGRMTEVIRLARQGGNLVSRSLTRELFDGSGQLLRKEHVPDFGHAKLGLPQALYPEVALPFLLAWLPLDGQRRSVYAWINDRFIAKVYIEVEKQRASVSIGGRSHEVVELVMYPDLNDWVPMGTLLTKLAKPFLPKYHMWYERSAPHRLVRFEGPYGPPGAPELVLERLA
ncbi:MAG: hypothetical protein ACRENE_05225 [Polyangiaceae bacterium]